MLTGKERAVKVHDQMEEWAALDIPEDTWKEWVIELLEEQFNELQNPTPTIGVGTRAITTYAYTATCLLHGEWDTRGIHESVCPACEDE